MTQAAAFRGQPLLVLTGLLCGWFALRVALWQPSLDAALLAAPELVEPLPRRAGEPDARLNLRVASAPQLRSAGPAPRPVRAAVARIAPSPLPAASPAIAPAGGDPARPSTARAVVGHSLLLAAGLSQMELPATLAAYLTATLPPGVPAAAPLQASLPQPAPPPSGSRWSADGWLMVRQDTTTAVASSRPSYGRSQAGAVVRYRLAPASAHAPLAYVRASSALAGPLERDVVAGVSARPVPRVPLRLALEARVSETAGGTELRPAAIAVTELPPARLPHGARAEAYVQGGYVDGKFATAFVDGQGRVERTVARLGDAEVSAGLGAWGGAQKGAARLDIGPSAAISFRLGPKSNGARGRIAADYRFRVAGDAEPRSGPALTLSAGF
jgi:hypothetical protein